MKTLPHRGFSLIEALLGLFLLALLFLGVMQMNAQSRQSVGDAVVELQATQLAEEGVELLHAFGYDWVSRYAEHPLPGLGFDWKPVIESPVAGDEYTADFKQFQRRVRVTPVEEQGMRACRVEVQVSPLAGSAAEKALSRSQITAETLVLELPR